MLLDGGFAGMVLTATSSHNLSAERQYRYPTEYGDNAGHTSNGRLPVPGQPS